MNSTSKVLQPQQIEQFQRDGYTILRGAFSPDDASEARDQLWGRLAEEQVRRDEPATWQHPVVHLKEFFKDGPFQRAWSPKLVEAIDDVMGEGRWKPPTALGWWPVAFPGFDGDTWRPPQTDWHLDGIHFHHYLRAPDLGLLPLFFFSHVGQSEGGTAISVGSHRIAARVLAAAEPEGLDVHELSRRVQNLIEDVDAAALELTGEPGDIALLHPFMLHARSPKIGGEVRFICNPGISLHEPMNLDPTVRPLSPVEEAIQDALSDLR